MAFDGDLISVKMAYHMNGVDFLRCQFGVIFFFVDCGRMGLWVCIGIRVGKMEYFVMCRSMKFFHHFQMVSIAGFKQFSHQL